MPPIYKIMNIMVKIMEQHICFYHKKYIGVSDVQTNVVFNAWAIQWEFHLDNDGISLADLI
jgi:hypothetical protein